MKHKKFLITIIILLTAAFSYTAIASFFSQPTRAKGLVGHWSLSDENEVMGSELVANGTMEANSNWANRSTPTTTEQSSEQAHSGTYSWKITTDALYEGVQQELSLTVGRRYRMSGWVYVSNGTDARLQVYNDTEADTYALAVATTAEWTYLEDDFTVSEAGTVSILLTSTGNDATITAYYDDISIKEISTADLTPNENNGTVYGATYTTDRNAQSNKAMDFNGTSNYLYFGNTGDSVVDIGDSDFALSAWINLDSLDRYHVIVENKYSTNSEVEGYSFHVNSSNKLRFLIGDDSTNFSPYQQIQSSDTLIADRWYYVVAVRDGDTGKLYIDGKLDNSEGSGWSADLSTIYNLYIGKSQHSDYYLDGSIADVRIYNKALTQTEITELYESYNPKIKIGEKRRGLVGEWSLGDDEEVMGTELNIQANAASITNEANATTGWTNTVMPTFESSSVKKYSGDYSIHMATDSNGDNIYTSATTVTGKRYRASFYYYQETAEIAKIRFGMSPSGTQYSAPNTSVQDVWTKMSLDFTAMGTFFFLTIGEESATDNIDIYIDVVTLKEIDAADLTPYANNGTIMGSTTNEIYTTDRNGQSNKAMVFSGIDSYINIDGVVADVASDTAGTWMAWVKPTDGHPAEAGIIMSLADASTTQNVNINIPISGIITVTLYDVVGLEWVLSTTSEVWADLESTWKHIALVQDGTSPVLYVNGIVPAQAFSSSVNITKWMSTMTGADTGRIGTRKFNNGSELNLFVGSISNVKIYNRALSASEILDIYDDYNPIVKIGDLKKGLIGQWSLGEDEGGTGSSTYDMTPFENTGTRYGETPLASIYTTDRNGQSNKAMDFDGTSDYVQGTDTLVSNQDMTVSYWMYPDDYDGVGNMVAKGSHCSEFDHLMASAAFYVYGDNTCTQVIGISNFFLPEDENTWIFITQTYDSATQAYTLYKNTILRGLGTSTLNIGTSTFYIGTEDTTVPFYNGRIQDVRLYNRVLSTAEIKMLYEQY